MSSRGRSYMQRDKYTQNRMYGVCGCYLLGWKAWEFQESMTQDSYGDVEWYSSIVGKMFEEQTLSHQICLFHSSLIVEAIILKKCSISHNRYIAMVIYV